MMMSWSAGQLKPNANGVNLKTVGILKAISHLRGARY